MGSDINMINKNLNEKKFLTIYINKKIITPNVTPFRIFTSIL